MRNSECKTHLSLFRIEQNWKRYEYAILNFNGDLESSSYWSSAIDFAENLNCFISDAFEVIDKNTMSKLMACRVGEVGFGIINRIKTQPILTKEYVSNSFGLSPLESNEYLERLCEYKVLESKLINFGGVHVKIYYCKYTLALFNKIFELLFFKET
jgi:hypothetical protein